MLLEMIFKFLLGLCLLSICNGQFGEMNPATMAGAYLDAAIEGFQIVTDKHVNNSYSGYNSTTCLAQIKYFKASVEKAEVWALKAIDSWSKIPIGLASGHLRDLGNYDQCLSIEKDSDDVKIGNYRGQYCLTPITVIADDKNPMLQMAMKGALSTMKKSPGSFNINQKLIDSLPSLGLAFCIPRSCSPQVWRDIVDSLLNKYYIKTATTWNMCDTGEKPPLNRLQYISLAFFSSIFAAMVLSTLYELVAKHLGKDPSKLLTIFSIYSNGKMIFELKQSKSSGIIKCLDGIRVLSMFLVVFGHTYTVGYKAPYVNLIEYGSFVKTIFAIFTLHIVFITDTFFLIGGCLLGFVLLNQLEKRKGRINFPILVLSRYLRITIPLIACIFFSMTLYTYLGDGPLWNELVAGRTFKCETHALITMTYLHNYWLGMEMCHSESWYLAVDMQLFVISLFLIWMIWKWGVKVLLVLVVLMVASTALSFWTVYDSNFMISTMTPNRVVEYGNKMFVPTHMRVSSYFIGIFLAYFMHKYRDQKVYLSRMTVMGGWIMSNLLFLVTYYMFHDIIHNLANETMLKSAIYQSTARYFWTANLAWIIFACHNGYGGMINSILSHPLWQPLARISFCVYIVHFDVESYFVGRLRTPLFLDPMFTFHRAFAEFGWSCIVATIWCLAFEMPIARIEGIIFKKGDSRKETDEDKNRGYSNDAFVNDKIKNQLKIT